MNYTESDLATEGNSALQDEFWTPQGRLPGQYLHAGYANTVKDLDGWGRGRSSLFSHQGEGSDKAKVRQR